MIPFVDFGGAGPRLHFAHAAGYPAGAYRPLVERLTPHYHVRAMMMRPPALFIRGAETDAFSQAASARVRRSLPRAVVHDMPGAGHLAPMEKPDGVGRIIHEFLSGANVTGILE